MRSTVPALLVVALLVASGCAGTAPNGGATPTPTAGTTASAMEGVSPTPTDAGTPGATGTPTTTETGTATPTERYSVEYAVSAGGIPEEIGSVELTLQVVFVENRGDFAHGRCWPSTFRGPHRPTITPIPPPEGGCGHAKKVGLDLADVEGTRSLGEFAVTGPYSAGHALLVTDVRATYRNGTRVRRILGIDGTRAAVVEGVPNGSHHVELRIHAWDEPTAGGALYSLVAERGNRSGRVGADR